MSKIPNPDGPQVKVGDKVKITSGEFAGYVGEVISFVQDGKNWVETIRVVKEDGKVELIEVKNVAIELFVLVDKIVKSNVFKRFAAWIKKLFRKKKNKPDPK